MRTAADFVAIWQSQDESERPQLHVLTKDLHDTTPLEDRHPTGTALEDCLPRLATSVIATGLDRTDEALLVLLDQNLPEYWLNLPWELLKYRGEPVLGRLLAVRYANPVFGAKGPVSMRAARYLNLFPVSEYDFTRALEPLVKAQALRPCRFAFVAEEIAGISDLFILAHGDERGLNASDGHAWVLPQTRAMPQRIWLLACNQTGAMNRLALELLKRGTKTVIATTGDLSAPQTAAVVGEWLRTPHVRDPSQWLSEAIRGDISQGGIRTLTVWGELRLDDSPSASWNGSAWDALIGRQPALSLGDETTRGEFNAAAAAFNASDTWPITRRWMLSPLLCLAESYDHVLMRDLERQVGDMNSPEVLRGLAASARRIGHYPQMARYLGRGLNAKCLTEDERASFLGQLANLLIDLDLPRAATNIIASHEDCALENPTVRQIQDFRRLDWKARCHARNGDLHLAIADMEAKRSLADPDDNRELAWLLYLGAWSHLTGTTQSLPTLALANEVFSRLPKIALEGVGQGNENSAYLLRALAAFSWATADRRFEPTLRQLSADAEARLSSTDPGPWAYTIAYLHLMGVTRPLYFTRAMNALERARYFLEAAIFLSLHGQTADSERLLHRFQERRTRTVSELMACTALLDIDLGDELDKRHKLECAIVGSREALLSGAMPPL